MVTISRFRFSRFCLPHAPVKSRVIGIAQFTSATLLVAFICYISFVRVINAIRDISVPSKLTETNNQTTDDGLVSNLSNPIFNWTGDLTADPTNEPVTSFYKMHEINKAKPTKVETKWTEHRIIDPTISGVYVRNCLKLNSASENETPLQGRMMEFSLTEDTIRQPQFIRVTSGSSFQLQCSVSGYQNPEMEWLKDGNLHSKRLSDYQKGKVRMENDKPTRFPLSVENATVHSSGNYTCLACSPEVDIEITFTIVVLDARKSIPEMAGVHPQYKSERRGGTAKFHCWINVSDRHQESEAEWFKLLPVGLITNYSGIQELHSNTSLIVGEYQYESVPSNNTINKPDGLFHRQLLLHPLDYKTSGCYLCMATNEHGYSMQSACLFVQSNEIDELQSVSFAYMVVLPASIFLGLAACFVCWLRDRDLRRQEELNEFNEDPPEHLRPSAQQVITTAECFSPPPSRSNNKGVGRRLLMSGMLSGSQRDEAVFDSGLVSVAGGFVPSPGATPAAGLDPRQFNSCRRSAELLPRTSLSPSAATAQRANLVTLSYY